MDADRIGLVIKTLRRKVGLTQQQLAEKLGITDKAVSKWERGIGIPDISMINQLAMILNIDTDNLLAGNIAYLDNEWVGELRLDQFETEISVTTEIFGKPSVYFYLCYYALAGISDVYIRCSEEEAGKLKEMVGNGERYGLRLHFKKAEAKRIMAIDGPVFLYGPNLTKYFQRGMVHKNTSTRLIIPNGGEDSINLDWKRQASNAVIHHQGYRELPIVFIHESEKKVEYEPLGKGMIGIIMKNINDVMFVGQLLQILENYNKEEIYCLEEVVFRRGFIDRERLKNMAGDNPYLLKLSADR